MAHEQDLELSLFMLPDSQASCFSALFLAQSPHSSGLTFGSTSMLLRVTLTLYFTFLKLSPPALEPTFGDLCPRWFGLILVKMGAVYKAPEVGFLIIYKNDHMVCEIQTFCWFSFTHQIYGGLCGTGVHGQYSFPVKTGWRLVEKFTGS